MDAKSTTKEAAAMAVIPAFIASSCCLSPAMFLFFGISFGEVLTTVNPWVYRITALIILLLFLTIYLRTQGIKTISDYKVKKDDILVLLLHSVGIFLVFYWVLIALVVPVVCQTFDGQLSCML